MTDSDREAATRRRARIAEAIAAHRRAGSPSPVAFGADVAGDPVVLYEDREITVAVSDAQRERLDALLDSFHVFKIAQPATRKAPDGEVHVSAIADPKHAADFLDRLFLDVFAAPADYDLVIDD